MTCKASGRSALILAAGLLLCLSGPVRAIEYTDGQTANATEEIETPGKPVALNKFTKSRARGKSAAKSRRSRGVLAHGFRRKPMDSKTVVSGVTDVKRDARTRAGTDDKNDAKIEGNINDPKVIDDTAPGDTATPVAAIDQPLPDNVANANAQWPAPNSGTPPRQTAGTASTPPSLNTVASDQLNDVDKTLSETPVAAPAEPSAEPKAQMAQTASAQSSQDKLMSMAQADQQSVSSSDSAWGQSSNIGKIFIAIGGLLTFASAIRMFMA